MSLPSRLGSLGERHKLPGPRPKKVLENLELEKNTPDFTSPDFFPFSLTFPWPLWNSLTFPVFPGEWSPWSQALVCIKYQLLRSWYHKAYHILYLQQQSTRYNDSLVSLATNNSIEKHNRSPQHSYIQITDKLSQKYWSLSVDILYNVSRSCNDVSVGSRALSFSGPLLSLSVEFCLCVSLSATLRSNISETKGDRG